MLSDVPEDTLPEGTSSTESAMLEPDILNITSGEKPDKEEGVSVVPGKATVGENPITDISASI
jgi:hypothetical protein